MLGDFIVTLSDDYLGCWLLTKLPVFGIFLRIMLWLINILKSDREAVSENMLLINISLTNLGKASPFRKFYKSETEDMWLTEWIPQSNYK